MQSEINVPAHSGENQTRWMADVDSALSSEAVFQPDYQEILIAVDESLRPLDDDSHQDQNAQAAENLAANGIYASGMLVSNGIRGRANQFLAAAQDAVERAADEVGRDDIQAELREALILVRAHGHFQPEFREQFRMAAAQQLVLTRLELRSGGGQASEL
jgi:hypothetical protein